MPRKTVTDKKTKAEVREAFQTILKDTAERSKEEEKPSPLKPDVQEAYSIDSIVGQLSNLRITVGKYFAELEQQLVAEAEKLQKIRNTITEETKRLKETLDIDTSAMSLFELLQKQEEQKFVFEEEIAKKRNEWEEEQREHDRRAKERDESVKKERAREQEEYQYELKRNRQREKEEFEEGLSKTRVAFEEETKKKLQELQLREETLKAKEKELEELHKQVEAFPSKLAKEVQEAEKRSAIETEERFKMEKVILEKDVEKERELFKLNIVSLQEKIKEQDIRIKNLERDLKASMEQSHEVASKAIEGIAGIRVQTGERKQDAEKPDFQNRS